MQLKKIRQFCFIPFFIAIYLLFFIAGDVFNTALDRLDVVSIATFENYSVDKVITFYQLFIGGGILCTGLLFILFSWLYDKSMKFRVITDFLNPLCAVGILMMFFAYTSLKTFDEFNFLTAIAVGYIFYILFFQIKTVIAENQHIFWALAALSLTLTFFVREFLLFFNFSTLPNIALIWLTVFLTITIVLRYVTTKTAVSFRKIFYISRPLFFLPLLSVLKNEIYLIFNQRGIEIFSPNGWYLTGIFVIFFSMFLLLLNKKKSITIKKELYYYLFPSLLTGLAAIGYYTPFLTSSEDFFELANPANTILRTVIGCEIPIVDYLSSHGVSELCFGGLYVLLNGFSGTIDFFLYQFIFFIIYYLICYYLLMRIFGKNPIIFFFILFFPYLRFLLPTSYIFAACLLFLLYRFFKQPCSRNLLYVGLFSILTAFWRFDLGFPCTLITIIFLTGYLIFRYSKKILFTYIKIAGVFLFIAASVGVILYMRMPEQFISNILQAKDYLSYNQAHAYPQIASDDLKVNFYHHIFSPIAAGVMLLLLFYLKKTKQISMKNNFLWISTLFFLLFYFFNFQRGLVRHSLYEGMDSFTSVFFCLSSGLFLVLLLSQKTIRFKTTIFLLFVTTWIYVTRYPDVEDAEDLFGFVKSAYINSENIGKLPEKTVRVIDADIFAEKNYNDLKHFFDANFDRDNTFIDFSNTPMLYFYLQREVPSYFCQYMQNTVTEFLQKENLKLLQTKNVPIVLFSNYPATWFDYTDGVPNTLRYNIICKYIYDNYVPYTVLNNHAVWIKKGITLKNPIKDTSLTFAYQPQNYNLRKYPYLLGKYGDFVSENHCFTTIYNRKNLSISDRTEHESSWIFVKVNDMVHNTNANLSYYQNHILMGSMEFEILSGTENQQYVLPVNAQYNWYSGLADEISIDLTDISSDATIDVSFFQQ